MVKNFYLQKESNYDELSSVKEKERFRIESDD